MTTLPRRCVYLVTDRRRLAPDARTTRDEIAALESFLDDAVAAGVDVIQIRERDLDGGPLTALTARVRARAETSQTVVLVNDRADVAIAGRAHGVHLRSDGPPIGRVRSLRSEPWIVGRSVHSPAEAREAGDAGADYVLFGTVFGGGSKGAVGDGDQLPALAAALRSSKAPVIAIGGIDPARAAICHRAGAAGVAAISLFLPEGRAPLAIGVVRAVSSLRDVMSR